jgi:hypothetical protein
MVCTRLEAGMVRELPGGHLGEEVDLDVERVEQPPRGRDPGPRRRRHHHPLEEFVALESEQVAHRHGDALVGQHRVDLAAQTRAQVDQFGSMTNQITQLPRLRWGNPRLGQAVHPQQISKIESVSLVVLDPPIGETLHSQRVRQMHAGTQLGERVRGPIPPVRRLEHHLRRLTRPRQHRRQPVWIVDDPHRLQRLPSLGHPHQH